MTDERYPDTPGLQGRLLDEIDAAGPIGAGVTKLSCSLTAAYGREFLEITVRNILDRLVREGKLCGGVAGTNYRTQRHERAHALQTKADRVRWLRDEITKREGEFQRLQDSLPELRERLATEQAALDVLAAELYPDTAADVPTLTSSGVTHTEEP